MEASGQVQERWNLAIHAHQLLRVGRLIKSRSKTKSFVALSLVFDYNKRNFVPESEPAVARIDEMGQFAQELRQGYASIPPLAANQCKLLIVSTVEGMVVGSVMPYVGERPTQALTRASWRELQELLNDVTLMSSKFATWPSLLQQNLRSLINNSIRASTQFQPFLVKCALDRVKQEPSHDTCRYN
jgi:hypothetical protein